MCKITDNVTNKTGIYSEEAFFQIFSEILLSALLWGQHITGILLFPRVCSNRLQADETDRANLPLNFSLKYRATARRKWDAHRVSI